MQIEFQITQAKQLTVFQCKFIDKIHRNQPQAILIQLPWVVARISTDIVSPCNVKLRSMKVGMQQLEIGNLYADYFV